MPAGYAGGGASDGFSNSPNPVKGRRGSLGTWSSSMSNANAPSLAHSACSRPGMDLISLFATLNVIIN